MHREPSGSVQREDDRAESGINARPKEANGARRLGLLCLQPGREHFVCLGHKPQLAFFQDAIVADERPADVHLVDCWTSTSVAI